MQNGHHHLWPGPFDCLGLSPQPHPSVGFLDRADFLSHMIEQIPPLRGCYANGIPFLGQNDDAAGPPRRPKRMTA